MSFITPMRLLRMPEPFDHPSSPRGHFANPCASCRRCGQHFGSGDAVPLELTVRADAARRARVPANRLASCKTCPSQLGRMTPGGLIAVPTTGPQAGYTSRVAPAS